MRSESSMHVVLTVEEVKAADGQLILEGKVRLEFPQPPQDDRLPHEVERMVEEAGQEFKRWAYQQLLEKLDAELALAKRQGKEGQGVICRGSRRGIFKTVFGTVSVHRRRLENKADRSTETPAAKAWGTPQQVTITQGLTDAVCDALLQEPSRKALRTVEQHAAEPGLLGRVTVLNLVHEEGSRLRAAARRRAEAVFAADGEAAQRLLPRVAEPSVEDALPLENENFGEVFAGFPGSSAADMVGVDQPRRVEADTVMVQADEVLVDAQASTGRKEILVYNAVVSTAEATWYFSEESAPALIFLVGALLATFGVHRGQRRLLFLNDGAQWIRDWFEGLQVPAKGMVLCWYHLAKRCLNDLGMACGWRRAQKIGRAVLGHLWRGRLEEALEVLTRYRTEMKNRPALDQLVRYLGNRRPYLPCYQARWEAGLWIASNRVEKLNDWAVSQRCKCRGMGWTGDGVVSLAALESARRNGDLPYWRRCRELPALVASPQALQAA